MGNHDRLQMAVHAVNETMGSERLCPMSLVLGAIPRPERVKQSPNQVERQKAIEKAKKAVMDEESKKQVSFTL